MHRSAHCPVPLSGTRARVMTPVLFSCSSRHDLHVSYIHCRLYILSFFYEQTSHSLLVPPKTTWRGTQGCCRSMCGDPVPNDDLLPLSQDNATSHPFPTLSENYSISYNSPHNFRLVTTSMSRLSSRLSLYIFMTYSQRLGVICSLARLVCLSCTLRIQAWSDR